MFVKKRTEIELRCLEMLHGEPGFPQLISYDDNNIVMKEIKGVALTYVYHKSVYVDEIVALVKRLHEIGIVHCDLYSRNIIIGDRVYIVDFDSAKIIADEDPIWSKMKKEEDLQLANNPVLN